MGPPLGSTIFGMWFDAAFDGAFVVERTSGTVVCANSRFAAMLGQDVASVIGKSLACLHQGEHGLFSEQMTDGGHCDQVGFWRADGESVFLSVTATPVPARLGTDLVACLVRDTTARDTLERERLARHSKLHAAHRDLEQLVGDLSDAKLQLEERNHEIAVLAGQVSRFGWRAAIGELVAGIAHHLNNPVGALSSTLRRLECKIEEVSDLALRDSLLVLVRRSREIGVRIESNVDAVVRAHEVGISDPTRQWLVLREQIETALSMFADRLDKVMVVRDYGEEPAVLVPRDSLHLVISNLIDNSLRAMVHGGTLALSVRQLGDQIALRISDTGGGVPAAVMPHLFEPILSARPGGTGLGLSTAQRLARAWGGDIMYAATGNGSAFEVFMPLKDLRVTVEATPPSHRPAATSVTYGPIPLVHPSRGVRRGHDMPPSQEPKEDPK